MTAILSTMLRGRGAMTTGPTGGIGARCLHPGASHVSVLLAPALIRGGNALRDAVSGRHAPTPPARAAGRTLGFDSYGRPGYDARRTARGARPPCVSPAACFR